MKNILYIDNRIYGHNRDIHVDFIDSLNRNKLFKIIGYGKGLHNLSFKYYKPNIARYKNHLFNIIKKEKINAILTYNRNGSSYASGGDNISLYEWISKDLKKIGLPKFHITTDYCRGGFKKEQADWFKEMGISAAIFRTKDSLKHPIDVDSYLLPFSVDSNLYNKFSTSDIRLKKKMVSFIGSAGDVSKEIYKNRIAAINFLLEKDMLITTKILDNNFKRKMLFKEDYVKFLSSNRFSLTCGGICNFMTAKYFQIPAAKSMLVCTDTVGLEDFPRDLYIKYSINNLDKMLDQINYYNNNDSEYIDKVMALNSFVIKNHNNRKRGLELKAIIGRYF